MIAPLSQMVRSVFGSWIVGKRPLGLSASYSGFLISVNATGTDSNGSSRRVRMIPIFKGLGPRMPP